MAKVPISREAESRETCGHPRGVPVLISLPPGQR